MEIIHWATCAQPMELRPCETNYAHNPASVPRSVQQHAARYGHLNVLQWFKEKNHELISATIDEAATYGQEEIVDWLLSCGVEPTNFSSMTAATYGHYELAKKLFYEETGIKTLAKVIAYQGKIDFLEWLKSKDANILDDHLSDCGISAISGGQTQVMDWLIAEGWTCSEEESMAAAATGKIEMVKFTLTNGASLTAGTMAIAASKGHIELLEWLRANGCPWDADTTKRTAYEGELETLKWLIGNGCPLDVQSADGISATNLLKCEKGDILKFLRNHGLVLDQECYITAIERKLSVQFLDWLYDNGCPLTSEVWKTAVQIPSEDIFKWLKEKGCAWAPRIAFYGPVVLRSLKWLHRNGFDLDIEPSITAATYGQLPVLQWLKKKGYSFSTKTCEEAAVHDKYEVFKWLVENDCPVDFTVFG